MILNSTLQEMNNKELTVQIIQIQNDLNKLKKEVFPSIIQKSEWYKQPYVKPFVVMIVFSFLTCFFSPVFCSVFKNSNFHMQMIANTQIGIFLFLIGLFI